MPTGRERETELLQSRWERPLLGVFRATVYGAAIALVLTIMNYFIIEFQWYNLFGFLLVGIGISLFGWGSDRLWHSTISKMVMNPFSVLAYSSRLPFWFIAGGIGYTLGMLIAKKYGLLAMYDVPVKQLFQYGGKVGCVIQIPVQIIAHRSATRGFVRNISSSFNNH